MYCSDGCAVSQPHPTRRIVFHGVGSPVRGCMAHSPLAHLGHAIAGPSRYGWFSTNCQDELEPCSKTLASFQTSGSGSSGVTDGFNHPRRMGWAVTNTFIVCDVSGTDLVLQWKKLPSNASTSDVIWLYSGKEACRCEAKLLGCVTSFTPQPGSGISPGVPTKPVSVSPRPSCFPLFL